MNSTMPWDSCRMALTSPSGTQRKAWSVRPGTVDGTVKSIIWLIAEPPFCVFYSAAILARQAGQMQ